MVNILHYDTFFLLIKPEVMFQHYKFWLPPEVKMKIAFKDLKYSFQFLCTLLSLPVPRAYLSVVLAGLIKIHTLTTTKDYILFLFKTSI